ncbi:MAG: formylglycine-generating enzyme family protein, partial [Candidatus Adiutrix sp.]|nr:formylglycine-generating enzyme family protein [Candidatus Adiutrix sp.]
LGGAAAGLAEETANSLGLEFVLIPAGSFIMGTDGNFEGIAPEANEKPAHRVTVSQPFYLGKYEVTQAQWEAVMGDNPSEFKGRSNPVERVSWEDVQEFIRQLNEMEKTDKYRLPTEAEWEYAARAGSTGAYSFGDDPGELGPYAWHEGNSGGTAHPAGQKAPNAWGLYDMYGNVLEWTQDWYDENYYAVGPPSDPQGPPTGSYRVNRGGNWDYLAGYCRSANRNFYPPDYLNNDLGFRLAFSPGR